MDEEMTDYPRDDEAPLLNRRFFERTVYEVAPDLIGCSIFTTIDDIRVGGVIVETEAYREDDPFAHCFISPETPRSKHSTPMLGSSGTLYFYYSGQLPCLNLVCERASIGSAVLIRAIMPVFNIDAMVARRTSWYRKTNRPIPKYLENLALRDRYLCNGPGVLTEALGIGDEHVRKSASIFEPPFEIRQATDRLTLVSGIRIGLDGQLERWKRNGDRRSLLPSVNEFGAKKWRWGAADFRRYSRHPSFEQEWQPR